MMWIWDFDPIALSILGLQVRWYGLAYIAGFFILLKGGYMIQQKVLDQPFKKETFEHFCIGLFLAGILGARLGFFAFYDPLMVLIDPLEIGRLWHGGMSIHGGLVGGLIFLWYWSYRYRIGLLRLTDIVVIPLAMGLILGRLGNFMNGELVGVPTDQTWGMIFPHVDGYFRHPSQLYEAAKNLVLTLILCKLFVQEKWKKSGYLTAAFLVGYGVLRFLIEYVRSPDSMIGSFTTGQVLCLVMVGGGGAILFSGRKERTKI